MSNSQSGAQVRDYAARDWRADDDANANVDAINAVSSPRCFAWPSMWRSMRSVLRSNWRSLPLDARGSTSSSQSSLAPSMQVAQQVADKTAINGGVASYQLDQGPGSRCILCGAGRVSCNERHDTCSLCCTPSGKIFV